MKSKKTKEDKLPEGWSRKVSRGTGDSIVYSKIVVPYELNLGTNKSRIDKFCFASIWPNRSEVQGPRAYMEYNFDSEFFQSRKPELILDYEDYFVEPLEEDNKQWMVDYLFAEAKRRIDCRLPLTDRIPYKPLTDRDFRELNITQSGLDSLSIAQEVFNMKPNWKYAWRYEDE